MRSIFSGIAILCLTTATVRAGGSLDTQQVVDILKKDTVLWTQVLEHFELHPTAWGVRCGRHTGRIWAGAPPTTS
jgi:hypothetical protein